MGGVAAVVWTVLLFVGGACVMIMIGFHRVGPLEVAGAVVGAAAVVRLCVELAKMNRRGDFS